MVDNGPLFNRSWKASAKSYILGQREKCTPAGPAIQCKLTLDNKSLFSYSTPDDIGSHLDARLYFWRLLNQKAVQSCTQRKSTLIGHPAVTMYPGGPFSASLIKGREADFDTRPTHIEADWRCMKGRGEGDPAPAPAPQQDRTPVPAGAPRWEWPFPWPLPMPIPNLEPGRASLPGQ
jgi:hypothetical protein